MFEIITNLWLGSKKDIKNTKLLLDKNIRLIVNLSSSEISKDNQFKYISVKKQSNIDINEWLFNCFKKIYQYIDNFLESFNGIIFFCDDYTKSSTIISCYLMLKCKLKSDKIVKLLQSKNNTINYIKYISCLKKLEKIIS